MTPYTTPEQADAFWLRMGEPDSSRAYLRTIYFDGEPVTVAALTPNPINQIDEE
jgi:hypothetical protein